MADFDIEFLKSKLAYDPVSGIFTWKVKSGGGNHRMNPGDRAGCRSGTGHRHIGVGDAKYLEHRLAYAFIYGFVPQEIDHINGIEDDNRICNLRPALHRLNIANGKHRKNNTSGRKGVYKENGKWRARIMVERKTINIGLFALVDEAHAAYMDAAKLHFGEFARSA